MSKSFSDFQTNQSEYQYVFFETFFLVALSSSTPLGKQVVQEKINQKSDPSYSERTPQSLVYCTKRFHPSSFRDRFSTSYCAT